MRISFDLDDTLFVSPSNFKVEPEIPFPWNKIYKERLRYGTVDLIRQLQEEDVEVWIYTTSFRSQRYIRGLLKKYGIRIDEVVNGERHAREVQRNKQEPMPSKYPSWYRIDLHIDDDKSVMDNGRTYGFKVMLVGQQDDDWAKKIIEYVREIKSKSALYK